MEIFFSTVDDSFYTPKFSQPFVAFIGILKQRPAVILMRLYR
jgi:hypothetical protein